MCMFYCRLFNMVLEKLFIPDLQKVKHTCHKLYTNLQTTAWPQFSLSGYLDLFTSNSA